MPATLGGDAARCAVVLLGVPSRALLQPVQVPALLAVAHTEQRQYPTVRVSPWTCAPGTPGPAPALRSSMLGVPLVGKAVLAGAVGRAAAVVSSRTVMMSASDSGACRCSTPLRALLRRCTAAAGGLTVLLHIVAAVHVVGGTVGAVMSDQLGLR